MQSSTKSLDSKQIKKSKFPVDVEAEKRFDALKRKYANAMVFLLVKNITRVELQQFFTESEENRQRFETIKRFRQAIIDSRPKAKLWVDKPFYVKLDLTPPVDEEGGSRVNIVLGGCIFKQSTRVVSTRKELEEYMETIAKIIDSENVWADPEMARFDIGERDYLSEPAKKPQSEDVSDASVQEIL